MTTLLILFGGYPVLFAGLLAVDRRFGWPLAQALGYTP